MLNHIYKIDPSASPEKAQQLAEIWGEVVSSIIKEMLDIANPQMEDLHINLREEMAHELAKLILFTSEKVASDRMNGRATNEIDQHVEREQCFSLEGKERISNTARNFASQIWLRKYNERWKPKTVTALRKGKNPNKKPITPKAVENNHFIPKSFIKRYWSESQFVYRNIKTPEGIEEKKETPFGSWGFRKNLYSDRLEAYFGLLEGDAVRPIQMMLDVEPLNRPQREALIGFIVIQRIRNPHFVESLKKFVAPLVASEVGADKAEDERYMRDVYETLYSQNEFYDKLARPIMYSRWVVVRSETPDFVLPDVCNIFGRHEGRQYVFMPLTPKDCLVVLPIEVKEPRIVPHYIKASGSMTQNISYILRCAAKSEFLSTTNASFSSVNEESNKIMQRIILSIAKITADE
ncbi:DUF4238 domain-containing protein [Pseudomonas sp. PDM16]|uniref:DUF4238 domain-containing protein n=1 Tax=Pseudomonas sp. PDM16 TaxID=2769292 RepID=UPI001CE21B37|nr:DUF4238 domain-containing protein [Pseudomonas sp. PDM16]